MDFQKIDLNTWPRKPWFEHYYSSLPCTYSMTVKIDITGVIEEQQKLYPVMLHALVTVVNRHEEFRTSFNRDGDLGVFSEMHPCYTVFHKQTETFSNIWTPYSEDYDRFLADYADDLRLYGNVEGISAKPNEPENTFPISMIPWESFDGFNLNLQKGYGYLLPIFTLGRYYEEGGRYYIPLAVQVHHAVCDGFHVCRFIEELRETLNLK
jgi:chloramphenicol O-acetyltransferase type A